MPIFGIMANEKRDEDFCAVAAAISKAADLRDITQCAKYINNFSKIHRDLVDAATLFQFLLNQEEKINNKKC